MSRALLKATKESEEKVLVHAGQHYDESTFAYGSQTFYSGPGIGGHCVPLDLLYLEHIAKDYSFELSMIDKAERIDLVMFHPLTIKIASALNRHKKPVNGARILFLGGCLQGGHRR